MGLQGIGHLDTTRTDGPVINGAPQKADNNIYMFVFLPSMRFPKNHVNLCQIFPTVWIWDFVAHSLKELQGQQSQSLSGIITFSLSSLTNEKYNTVNYRIKQLRVSSAKSMVRLTAVQNGEGSCVALNTFLSSLGFTFIIFHREQLYT